MIGVVLVGATGSIGRSTLDVLRSLGGDARLVGAFAGSNADGLKAIVREFSPRYSAAIGGGLGGLEEAIADRQTTVVVSAASGAAGLPASLLAVRHGKRLALANKESMVMAGALLVREAARTGAEIMPVDSEHSAIFQALRAGRREEVRRVILTASGGPFRTWPAERIARARPEDALKHPTWSMGRKITIDSATLMNKALELIEAHWLFGLRVEEIEVLVHPQSIVHGMVEFTDGSVVAQLGKPDMRLPIQYALSYPERKRPAPAPLDLRDFASLTFELPDRERFPALALGEEAVRLGGTAGAVLNAANEVAVERFLAGEIGFPAIAETAATVLRGAPVRAEPDLDDIHAADRAAREEARKWHP